MSIEPITATTSASIRPWHIVSDGTAKPYRVHFRNPSFATLQAIETMCKGRMLADVIAVVGSIDIVLGEIDR